MQGLLLAFLYIHGTCMLAHKNQRQRACSQGLKKWKINDYVKKIGILKNFLICRTDVTRGSTWLSIFDLQMFGIIDTHKTKSGNIKGTLTTCSIWPQSCKALRQMCNFAYAKCTPEFHSNALLAGGTRQEKGQLADGPFFSTTTINFYFQMQPLCSIHLNDVMLNSADLC